MNGATLLLLTHVADGTCEVPDEQVRRLVRARDSDGTIKLLEHAIGRLADEDTEQLEQAVATGGPPDIRAVAGAFLDWATKPSGGPWANLATARVARDLRAHDPFLDEIVHHWNVGARDGLDDEAFIIERINDVIEWVGDDPDAHAFVKAAASADLAEVAQAAITWARQRRDGRAGRWSSAATATIASFLERRNVLKELVFYRRGVVAAGDTDAVLRLIVQEIESWRGGSPDEWPGTADYEAAQRADLREIAEQFLGWAQMGAVSADEAAYERR